MHPGGRRKRELMLTTRQIPIMQGTGRDKAPADEGGLAGTVLAEVRALVCFWHHPDIGPTAPLEHSESCAGAHGTHREPGSGRAVRPQA